MAKRRRKNGKVSKTVKKYVERKFDSLVEDKHYNFVIALTASTGAGSMDRTTGINFPLAAMANGTGVNQRLGNMVTIKKIMIDLDLQMGAGIACFGRVLVVQDKQQGGVDPSLVQILDGGGGGIGTSDADVTPYNPYLTPSRFKILKDWRFVFDNVQKIYTTKRFIIDGKRLSKVHYQTTGTNDGKGMIYVVGWSNIDAASNPPRLRAGVRTTYEDA